MSAAQVTNRTDYAVRAVLYLSMQEPGKVVPISEIAGETGLSIKFLEEILLLLRTAGIVQSRRGKQGGYRVLRAPGDLTVADVVRALEGNGTVARAESEVEGRRPFHEVTEAVFDAAACAWWRRLSETRFSDLADELARLEAERSGAHMFHI